MLYNVPLFSAKSAFCITFMASILLIKQKIQRLSEPLMFKITISQRFIDIINMTSITDIWLKLKTIIQEIPRVTNITLLLQKRQFYQNIAFIIYKHSFKNILYWIYLYTNPFLKIYYSSSYFYSY